MFSERLTKEKADLEDRISRLSALLDTYMAREQRYLQLANQKADAQRQMTFMHHLHQSAATRGSMPLQRRRSLSVNDSETEEKPKQTFIYTNF